MSQWNGAMEKRALSPNLLLENFYVMLIIKIPRVPWYPKSSTERAGFAEVLISENSDREILGLCSELP